MRRADSQRLYDHVLRVLYAHQGHIFLIDLAEDAGAVFRGQLHLAIVHELGLQIEQPYRRLIVKDQLQRQAALRNTRLAHAAARIFLFVASTRHSTVLDELKQLEEALRRILDGAQGF